MKKSGQKFIAAILIVSIILPTVFFHKKAEAQFVPVHDSIVAGIISAQLTVLNLTTLQTAIATGAVTIKEVGPVPGISPLAEVAVNPITGPGLAVLSLDFFAVSMAKALLQKLTNSIVEWIDRGFPGEGPAFVQDPGSFLADVADTVAGEFIDGTELGFLCEPFELDIKAALNYRYKSSFEERISCRLSDVIKNVEDFAEFSGDSGRGISANFYKGGWDGWISLVRQNQYSTYLASEAELGVRIRGRQNIELLQLNWGDGFLSFQDCIDPPGAPLSECKVKGPIKTPGKVIETGLGKALGAELTQLELADSFDRILAALLNQLISKALGSSGLAG